MEKYWSDIVKQLRPYEPGEQPSMDGVLKLNTNENFRAIIQSTIRN